MAVDILTRIIAIRATINLSLSTFTPNPLAVLSSKESRSHFLYRQKARIKPISTYQNSIFTSAQVLWVILPSTID